MCASSIRSFAICAQLPNPTRVTVTPNEANPARAMKASHRVASPFKGEGEDEDLGGKCWRAKLRTPHSNPLPLRRGEAGKLQAIASLVLVLLIVLVNLSGSRALATPLSA